MQRMMRLAAPLVFLAVVLAFVYILPLGQAVEFGKDEGFELAKAFLQYQGFHLYSQIWSDQPPLFTGCLSALFKATGPSILAARIMTVVFSVALLFALFAVVRRQSGRLAAWSAVMLLASAPAYLPLSISVMQEVPAFSLAMMSVWALFRWRDTRKSFWLPFSGALMGGALMIKFTAGLVIPAMLGEIFLAVYASPERVKICGWNVCRWGMGVAAVVIVLALVLGFGSFTMLVGSHVEAQEIPGMAKASDLAFPASIIWDHWEVYLATLVALGVVISRKLWREAAFPVVLLATVSLVHWLHRPWWICYYLHHAIPLAWLSGIAVREMVRELWQTVQRADRLRLRTALAAILLTVLLIKSGTRMKAEILAARSQKTVASDVMLAHVIKYRAQTQWFYAQPVIYAFHARLRIPPELAVVARKRYWSGQMTGHELLSIVQQYKPEQLLLLKGPISPEWTEFLKSNYVLDYDDGQQVLYIAQSLKTVSP